MADVTGPRSRARAVVRKQDGNPEGKGVSGLQSDWQQTEPRGVVAKPQRQVLAEFFTSMLVLSAQFKYRPVVGTPNYLYWMDGKWLLSLIAPQEWSAERQAAFAGTCVLQADRTWTIAPAASLAEGNGVAAAIVRFYEAFTDIVDTDLALEDVLPDFVASMPYYQRLHASALSRSLKRTLLLGEQTSIRGRDWLAQLPHLDRLLPHAPG